MRIPISWLKEYIDISDITAEQLADELDLSGTAVESVEAPGKGLNKIVVGEVKEVSRHPDADKLVLVKVDIAKKALKIVCGAKNFEAGDKVPVALAGAVMPSGMEIRKANIRGKESNGMLASELELNLGEDHSGIMILPPDSKTGEPLARALGLDDYILDLEITPNRPDSMSILGIAREVSAVLKRPYKMPKTASRGERREASKLVKVELMDSKLCPRYTAKVVTDLVVGPSPSWMQKRLIAAGARPINNLVDITNYVLFELGQPLHAFDYELIPDSKIIIRKAKKDEKIVTLDDIERTLTQESLVIADKNGPVALAGIMGGIGSEVNEQTKIVLLESAYFEPKNISRTSREMGLISESSIRFERGVDPNGVLFASERACHLYQEIAEGKVLKGAVDKYPQKINPVKIDLRPARVNKILGTSLNKGEIKKKLQLLELKVKDGAKFSVEVPTFRPDLEREIDLIEEVARLHGLNNINSTLPESGKKQGKLNHEQKNVQMVRDLLVSSGYMEAFNYGFIDPKLNEQLNLDEEVVEVTNPLSEEQSVLRTNLLPGLVKNAINNFRYGAQNLKLFEIGYVFNKRKGDVPQEIKRLALIGSGALKEKNWMGEPQKADFYYLKGTIQEICAGLQINEPVFQKEDHPSLEKGQSAGIYFGEEKAGFTGVLSKEVMERLDIEQDIYVTEIDYAPLMKYAKSLPEYIPISKYPGIRLDVALLVDGGITNDDIKRIINETGEELLKSASLFDLYKGKGIPEGKKSMAYSLFYQAFDRTLTTDEAVALHEKVKKALVKELGAEIR